MAVILSEKDIVKCMQRGTIDEIYYAWFSRDREYSYHSSNNLKDVCDHLEIEYDEEMPIAVSNDGHVDIRGDEWVIFGTDDLRDKFIEYANTLQDE